MSMIWIGWTAAIHALLNGMQLSAAPVIVDKPRTVGLGR